MTYIWYTIYFSSHELLGNLWLKYQHILRYLANSFKTRLRVKGVAPTISSIISWVIGRLYGQQTPFSSSLATISWFFDSKLLQWHSIHFFKRSKSWWLHRYFHITDGGMVSFMKSGGSAKGKGKFYLYDNNVLKIAKCILMKALKSTHRYMANACKLYTLCHNGSITFFIRF